MNIFFHEMAIYNSNDPVLNSLYIGFFYVHV